jgi:hypothetical protein
MIRPQIVGWREVLQAVRPVLQEGFPPQATGSPVGVSQQAGTERKASREGYGALLLKAYIMTFEIVVSNAHLS